MPEGVVTRLEAFRATPNMTSKKPCRLAQINATPKMELLPAPQSAQEVVAVLRFAACFGLANPQLVGHLEEMSALFPEQLVGAYKAFRERQACDN
jgi:hypothetical protein